MDAQLFKSLQVKKTKIQAEIADLRKTLKELDKQLGDRERAFNQVQQELDAVLKNNPVVSEHAMLRYIERFLGINLKEIEKDILSEDTLKIIDKISSGKIPFKKDHILIVKNKTVVTISPSASD